MAQQPTKPANEVKIDSNGTRLDGFLTVPNDAKGVVVFAHGSGSSRFSTRNQMVATFLNDYRYATLLFDLLTEEEQHIDDQTRHLRFDIHLLSSRLIDAVDWLGERDETKNLPIGLFGASTGAAAALVAGAARSDKIQAIVSRGGRPDLAGTALGAVRAPTLLIVGEQDEQVLKLNREAMDKMTKAEYHLEIIPGATHLFPEPGKLEETAQHAKDWFEKHLSK